MRILLPVLLTVVIQSQATPPPAAPDPVTTLVERLDL
jgi:hypothetical protein